MIFEHFIKNSYEKVYDLYYLFLYENGMHFPIFTN